MAATWHHLRLAYLHGIVASRLGDLRVEDLNDIPCACMHCNETKVPYSTFMRHTRNSGTAQCVPRNDLLKLLSEARFFGLRLSASIHLDGRSSSTESDSDEGEDAAMAAVDSKIQSAGRVVANTTPAQAIQVMLTALGALTRGPMAMTARVCTLTAEAIDLVAVSCASSPVDAQVLLHDVQRVLRKASTIYTLYRTPIIRGFTIEWTRVDVCVKECVLFFGNFSHLAECPVCFQPRHGPNKSQQSVHL